MYNKYLGNFQAVPGQRGFGYTPQRSAHTHYRDTQGLYMPYDEQYPQQQELGWNEEEAGGGDPLSMLLGGPGSLGLFGLQGEMLSKSLPALGGLLGNMMFA